MKRLVVHIGNPKAGSTSLQTWLASHRRALSEAGIDYPVLRGRATEGHRALALALEGGAGEAAAGKAVAAFAQALEQSRGDTVVISAEQFQGAPDAAEVPARIAALAAAAGYRPVAVVFLRPQPAYLNSVYTQHVQRLFTADRFPRFLERSIGDRRYDYDAQYRQWSERADFDFVPVPFTGAELVVGVERRFLMAAGLADRLAAIEALPGAPTANASPGPNTVETFRRLAARSGRARLGEAYGEARVALDEATDRLGWNATRFVGLDGDLTARIEARFADANDAFARRHWGRAWDDVFARDRARVPVPNALDPKTTAPALSAEIDRLVRAVLEVHGRPETVLERMRRFVGL